MLLNEIKKPSNIGTYAGGRFDDSTTESLRKYIEDNNIPNPVGDFHTTILYSRKHCPNYQPIIYDSPISGKAVKLEKFDDGNVLSLVFDSPELSKRHDELMKEHEATWDYPEYIPHVTLSYDASNVNIEDLTPPDFGIKITKEYLEQLDL